MKILRKPHLISLVAILVFLSFVSFGNFYEHKRLEEIRMCQKADLALRDVAFGDADESVIAKSYFVYDFTKNRALSKRDSDRPLPLASLTKLMTIRVVEKNKAEPETYTVQEDDLTSDGSVGFVVGDTFAVADLVKAALIASSNDAAVMLAHSTGLSENAFSAVMNIEAKKLGLSTLSYGSATGLDTKNGEPTAIGSAHDALMLLEKNQSDFPVIFAESTLATEKIAATNGRGITLQNTNDAIEELDTLVAGKTGYTITAGGNLAVLWREKSGDLVGAVVLGSTEQGRFSDMISLHDATGIYLSSLDTMPVECARINYYESN